MNELSEASNIRKGVASMYSGAYMPPRAREAHYKGDPYLFRR